MNKRILSSLATTGFLLFASSAYAQSASICPYPTNYVVVEAGKSKPMITVKPENEKENSDGKYIAVYEFDQSGLPKDTRYTAHCSATPYAPGKAGFYDNPIQIPEDYRVCILETKAERTDGTFQCY